MLRTGWKNYCRSAIGSSPKDMRSYQYAQKAGVWLCVAVRCHAMPLTDLAARFVSIAIGAVFVHDAVWWTSSWYFGRPFRVGGSVSLLTARLLYRTFLCGFGFS